MKTLSIILLIFNICIPLTSYAESSGAALLFRGKRDVLTNSEKQQIFSLLDITVTPDGKKLIDSGCENEAYFDVEIIDMNKDKTFEVLISGGNTCTSGITGSSIWLFIRDTKGTYRLNLGVPAARYAILNHHARHFPDLLIDDRGFCSARWRWNGAEYQHFQNVPTAKGGCDAH